MSIVLDTCVLSELTRPAPHRGLAAWFERQDAAALYLSALTVGELDQGIALLPAGRKKTALAGWLAALRVPLLDPWAA